MAESPTGSSTSPASRSGPDPARQPRRCHERSRRCKPKEYETIYILRSDVDADTAEKVQARVAEVVGRENGKLVKVEAWGRRKLAYPVAKQKRGVYVYVKYVGRGRPRRRSSSAT